MPDGKRKRRHSQDQAKRRWYALHRARRFRRRFWSRFLKSDNEGVDSASRDELLSPSV